MIGDSTLSEHGFDLSGCFFPKGLGNLSHGQIRGSEFNQMLHTPISNKLPESRAIMEAIFYEFDNVAVACSWGKDSQVVLELALEVAQDLGKSFRVVFCDTKVEDMRTLAFRDLYLARHKGRFEYREVSAPKGVTYWTIAAKYGLPGDNRNQTREPKCCYYLKVKPMIDYMKSPYGSDIDIVLLGFIGDEGRYRRLNYFSQGAVYHNKTWDCHKATPLIFWKEQDVWEYIYDRELPFNQGYLDVPRMGCLPCTGYISWPKHMSKQNMKMYRHIQHLRGQMLIDLDYTADGSRLLEPVDLRGLEQYASDIILSEGELLEAMF